MEECKPIKLPKNVNDYVHLIKASICNHHELEWYLDLRRQGERGKVSKKEVQPPSFLKREIHHPHSSCYVECRGRHELLSSQIIELPGLRRKAGFFSHLCHHRIGTAPNPSQLAFETTLREPSSSARDSSLPPRKSATRSKSPMRAASRTRRAEQPYSDLQVSIHSSELTHLFIPGATQQTLQWNMSLRTSGQRRPKTQLEAKKKDAV